MGEAPNPEIIEKRRLFATEVVRTLQLKSYRAFFVGGCVRDRLLGVQPKDYDVATSANPTQLQGIFPAASLVGAHFGVVLVKSEPDVHVEVATFRSEGEYSDGRRPDSVHFETDPTLDVQRRDFTINGLLEDPIAGRVIDFVGGQNDLSRKILRAIGKPERRFQEDHLRLLRAVRFAARLNFTLDSATRSAIVQLHGLIRSVSPERVRDELGRILMEGGARYGFQILSETGLLKEVLPEVEAFHGVEQPPEFHPEGDVWTHVLMMLQELKDPSPTLAWGVLLHDVGKPPTFRVADRIRFDGHAEVGARMTRDIMGKLRFSTDQNEQITALVANHMRFKDVKQMRQSALKRFLRLPHFAEHLELHRLDCMASNGRTDAYEFVKSALETAAAEPLQPARLMTGKDLLRLGYLPGPQFKVALEAVETAQLEHEIATFEEALILAQTYLPGSKTG